MPCHCKSYFYFIMSEEYLFDMFEFCYEIESEEESEEIYEPYITYDQEFEMFEDEQFANAYGFDDEEYDEYDEYD